MGLEISRVYIVGSNYKMATPMITANTLSTLKFSEMRTNKNRGRSVLLSTEALPKIFVQLPQLRSPYGLSSFVDEKSGSVSYSLDLSLTPELEAIFTDLDDKVLTAVADNSESWLGRKYSREVLAEALYKPSVRKSKKPEYPSTVRLKIYANPDGSLTPKAYDTNKNPIKLEQLRKGQNVRTMINIASIWFVDNKFGVSVRLQQAQFQVENDMDTCVFDDVVEESEENIDE